MKISVKIELDISTEEIDDITENAESLQGSIIKHLIKQVENENHKEDN